MIGNNGSGKTAGFSVIYNITQAIDKITFVGRVLKDLAPTNTPSNNMM
jgi:ABC-type branched-subunit amino acid transport system ATPase component